MQQFNNSDEYIKEIMTEQYETSMNLFTAEYEQVKDEILKEFLQAFDDLFKRCITMQKKDQKGDIAIISIFYLKSSILTESYNIQINLYDENFYMDRKDIYSLWNTSFLMKYFDKDIASLKKKAMQNIVGFGHERLQEFQMKYGDLYALLISKYCMERTADILALASFDEMKKQEELIITFGNYMDKGICIYPVDIEKGT